MTHTEIKPISWFLLKLRENPYTYFLKLPEVLFNFKEVRNEIGINHIKPKL